MWKNRRSGEPGLPATALGRPLPARSAGKRPQKLPLDDGIRNGSGLSSPSDQEEWSGMADTGTPSRLVKYARQRRHRTKMLVGALLIGAALNVAWFVMWRRNHAQVSTDQAAAPTVGPVAHFDHGSVPGEEPGAHRQTEPHPEGEVVANERSAEVDAGGQQAPPLASLNPQQKHEKSQIPDTDNLEKYMRGPPVEQGYYSGICYDTTNKVFVTEDTETLKAIKNEFSEGAVRAPAFISLVEPGFKSAKSRKVKNVPGLFLYADYFANDQTGAHHIFLLLPLLAAINRARSHRDAMKLPPTTILWKNSTLSNKHVKGLNVEVKLTNYMFAGTNGVQSLETHYSDPAAASLYCFEKMQMIMYDWRLLRVEDFTYLREMISKHGKTKRKLFEHCKDVQLKKPVVWLLSRRVYSRKWLNLPELVDAVHAVFGGADRVDVKVFDTPNLPCRGKATGFHLCNDSDPASLEEGMQSYFDPLYPFTDPLDGAVHPGDDRLHSVDWDIALYNQVTFFLSVHGAALANSIYQPRKSVVLEIMPYGIMDDSYPRIFRSMDISHVRYNELDDSEIEAEFGKHMAVNEIWNAQNRGRAKALGVRVNISALQPYLRHAKDLWEKDCKN
ncbi:hypothetical protein FVE85_6021 [Porphyridium purpureum]|uniref:Uncharacterized protein n=1 Tax=Porphyridium purpureum TaxID=35688 RepID=A0A5J4Z466_PORPP|nr:hypothetical protein FVE85_6021 [Porphyridium purpureum]|eukprot:POR6937..scf295_1